MAPESASKDQEAIDSATTHPFEIKESSEESERVVEPEISEIRLAGLRGRCGFSIPVEVWEEEQLHPSVQVTALVDTGAERSFISYRAFKKLPDSLQALLRETILTVKSANDSPVQLYGYVVLNCNIQGLETVHPFVVADVVEEMIIGYDYIQKYRVSWGWESEKLYFTYANNPARVIAQAYPTLAIPVEKTVLAPREGRNIRCQLLGALPLTGTLLCDTIDGDPQAAVVMDYSGKEIDLCIINRTDQEKILKPSDPIARVEMVEEVQVQACPQSDVGPVAQETLAGPGTLSSTPKLNLSEDILGIVERGVSLSSSQRKDLEQLLWDFRDTFATPERPFGRTNLVEHTIDVGDSAPIKQAPRRIPIHQVEIVEKAMQEMESSGAIRPSESPWASPIVVVRKKDGSHRFCIDYRKLNDCTRKDAYPLPRIEDALDALKGAQYFATIDLASGYWQVAMASPDKFKTAFTTRYGLYEWNVMPFGLCTAPATFQRLMEKVLKGLQWRICVVYLDDVVVFGRTWIELLSRLREVLHRLRLAGLKLKAKKCDFGRQKVAFLGHVVSAEGVSTDPDKVQQVQEWPPPINLKQVRAFLGLTSYYRKYIHGYADIARPMHDLTRKDEPFFWSEKCQQAFEELKEQLTSNSIMGYPQEDGGEYYLDTDASNCSIGATLSQQQEGRERVLAFGSRTLNAAEKNYCTTRRELLAIVHFVEHYRHYLLGRKFILRTDHGSLRWLLSTKNPSGQVARWIERLSQFHMEIQHRAGIKHGNADGMSRIPCPSDCTQCGGRIRPPVEEQPPAEEEPVEGAKRKGRCARVRALRRQFREDGSYLAEDDVPRVPHIAENTDPQAPNDSNDVQWKTESTAGDGFAEPDPVKELAQTSGTPERKLLVLEADEDEAEVDVIASWDPDELCRAQKEDLTLAKVAQWRDKPSWEEVANSSGEVKYWWNKADRLFQTQDGLLWYKWTQADGTKVSKLILPAPYQALALEALHDHKTAGHFGIQRTLHRLELSPVHWYHDKNAVREWCRRCDVCLRTKPPLRRQRAAMQSFTAGEPMERISVDILGPFPESLAGNRFVIVVTDYFSKWAEAYATKNHKADTVADCLVRELFTRYGLPLHIHSDQGTDFMSKLFKEMCELLEIRQTRTSPWRPQSDGQTERMNRTLGTMLKQLVNQEHDDWDTYLPYCTMAYRSSRHSSTQYTPNYLMYGRETRMPLNLTVYHPETEATEVMDPPRYVDRLRQKLLLSHTLARKNLNVSTNRQKRQYNRKSSFQSFEVGQGVWMYNPIRKKGRSPKLTISWEGPLAIIEKISSILYRVQKSLRSKSRVVHVDKLLPVRGSYDGRWITQMAEIEREQEAEELQVDPLRPDELGTLNPAIPPEPDPGEAIPEEADLPDRQNRQEMVRPSRRQVPVQGPRSTAAPNMRRKRGRPPRNLGNRYQGPITRSRRVTRGTYV